MPLLLIAAITSLTTPGAVDSSSGACAPRIARNVRGEISQLSVDSVRRLGTTRILKGKVTALRGMGDPGPGMASAHHLIRVGYKYVCSLRAGKVTTLKLISTD